MPIPADFRGRAEPLSTAVIDARADSLTIPRANMRAVAKIESSYLDAFLDTREPTSLFEMQQFHRLSGGRFDHVLDARGVPLSMPRRPERHEYGPAGEWQYTKLRQAMDLDRAAALESCSVGKFQVMAFNARLVGWPDVETFWADMCDSAAHHLDAFVGYIEATDLVGALRRGDFATFAAGYNGADYARWGYDTALAIEADRQRLLIEKEGYRRDGAVMFLGDSLARGIGAYWPDAINQARDGSTSRQWLEFDVGTIVRRFDPATVVVSLGVNDGDTAPDGIADRLRELRDEMDGTDDRRVIWCLPPTMPDPVESRAAATRFAAVMVATAFGDETFDMRSVAARRDPTDHIHYTWSADGWPRLAQALRAVVERGLVLGPGWTPPIPGRKPDPAAIPDDEIETVQQQVAATSRVTVSRRNRDAAMRRRIDRARRADQRG